MLFISPASLAESPPLANKSPQPPFTKGGLGGFARVLTSVPSLM
jgi:hypothetical protein